MKLRGTDPALVRRALAAAERQGVRPAARQLNIHLRTLHRWRQAAAELGPDWPTLDMDRAYLATTAERAQKAEQIAAYRRDLILGRHQPRVVPSVGTIRRIHALQRLGWTADLIAAHGPWASGDAVAEFTKRPRINRRNAEFIADIYDLLSMQLGPSDLTRRHAERQRWAPPLAWDDDQLDDPTARPSTSRRGTAADAIDEGAVERILAGERGVNANHVTRVEVVRRWDATGRSRASLARITGWKPERYGKLSDRAEAS